MKKFIKITGMCFMAFGLAACGGSSDGGNNRSKNNGAVNSNSFASNGGTPVANRTGEATYAGTFTGKVDPHGRIGSDGKIYRGGNFSGRVTAEADFDKDQIDVSLKARRQGDALHRFEGEFDDARISGGKFSGQGTHEVVTKLNGPRVKNSGKINGSFNANGSKISGKTRSHKDAILDIETDFSASEQ